MLDRREATVRPAETGSHGQNLGVPGWRGRGCGPRTLGDHPRRVVPPCSRVDQTTGDEEQHSAAGQQADRDPLQRGDACAEVYSTETVRDPSAFMTTADHLPFSSGQG